jgi:transcriptional regulator with XRE-family HTH domain
MPLKKGDVMDRDRRVIHPVEDAERIARYLHVGAQRLADASGITRNYVYTILNGARTVSTDTLDRWAAVCREHGRSVDDLPEPVVRPLPRRGPRPKLPSDHPDRIAGRILWRRSDNSRAAKPAIADVQSLTAQIRSDLQVARDYVSRAAREVAASAMQRVLAIAWDDKKRTAWVTMGDDRKVRKVQIRYPNVGGGDDGE